MHHPQWSSFLSQNIQPIIIYQRKYSRWWQTLKDSSIQYNVTEKKMKVGVIRDHLKYFELSDKEKKIVVW